MASATCALCGALIVRPRSKVNSGRNFCNRKHLARFHFGGERNRSAKLNWLQAGEIRRAYKPYVVTRRAIAEKLGVSRQAVGAVLSGKTWNGRNRA